MRAVAAMVGRTVRTTKFSCLGRIRYCAPCATLARSLTRLLALVGVEAAAADFWWPGDTGAVAWWLAGQA